MSRLTNQRVAPGAAKEHFKMYKKGKLWLTAGIFAVAIGTASVGGTKVQAANPAQPTMEPVATTITSTGLELSAAIDNKYPGHIDLMYRIDNGNGSTAIAPDMWINGNVDATYTVQPLDILGYVPQAAGTLLSSTATGPTSKELRLPLGTQNAVIWYKWVGFDTVKTHYVDENGKELVPPTESKQGTAGTEETVTAPHIGGYTVKGDAKQTVKHGSNQNSETQVTFTYTKNPEPKQFTRNFLFVDVTDPDNPVPITQQTARGAWGTPPMSYDYNYVTRDLEKEGYVYVSDNVPDQYVTGPDDPFTVNTYVIKMVKKPTTTTTDPGTTTTDPGTTTTDPGTTTTDPGTTTTDPGTTTTDPGTTTTDPGTTTTKPAVVKKGKLVVNYVDAQGNIIHKQNVITRKVGRQYKIAVPSFKGFTFVAAKTGELRGTFTAKKQTLTLLYEADTQTASVTYIDAKGKTVLRTDTLTGRTNQASDYDPTATIQAYLTQGYTLISNDFPEKGLTFDANDGKEQLFTIVLNSPAAADEDDTTGDVTINIDSHDTTVGDVTIGSNNPTTGDTTISGDTNTDNSQTVTSGDTNTDNSQTVISGDTNNDNSQTTGDTTISGDTNTDNSQTTGDTTISGDTDNSQTTGDTSISGDTDNGQTVISGDTTTDNSQTTGDTTISGDVDNSQTTGDTSISGETDNSQTVTSGDTTTDNSQTTGDTNTDNSQTTGDTTISGDTDNSQTTGDTSISGDTDNSQTNTTNTDHSGDTTIVENGDSTTTTTDNGGSTTAVANGGSTTTDGNETENGTDITPGDNGDDTTPDTDDNGDVTEPTPDGKDSDTPTDTTPTDTTPTDTTPTDTTPTDTTPTDTTPTNTTPTDTTPTDTTPTDTTPTDTTPTDTTPTDTTPTDTTLTDTTPTDTTPTDTTPTDTTPTDTTPTDTTPTDTTPTGTPLTGLPITGGNTATATPTGNTATTPARATNLTTGRTTATPTTLPITGGATATSLNSPAATPATTSGDTLPQTGEVKNTAVVVAGLAILAFGLAGAFLKRRAH
ncbi:mucin-binding protein [Lacticaseibacillus parakribbianus]|uniref:mucin-binding protein n=1 Tax=Lacticaseibacillus parakribbianus TaxID=2970927 RepID=UPI0021CB61FD|nr:MucBP domain-containing protein [Lacticaseibacillus parakribbianus]